MLGNLYSYLSNVGINPHLDASTARYIVLTNRFGIISGLISFIIFLLLFLNIPGVGLNITRILLLISAVLFGSVAILNKWRYYNLSKWLISWLPPLLLIYISISDKILLPELITIKDFFSHRFLLMASAIIPILVFSTRNLGALSFNLLPSFIGTVLFDYVHRPFKVAFNDFGFNDQYFFLLDIMIALGYLTLVGFLLNQRFVTDKHESKILLQQDVLRETNDELLRAKKTIEVQKHQLEGQNKNLESEINKKTKELSHVNEELIIYNNELRQFSHTLSHNLKSPVATFQGLLNLVEEDKLNAANKELMKYLKDSVEQMQTVFSDMNEMLELRNQLYTSTEEVDIRALFDNLHNHFYSELVRNNIVFNCNCNGLKSVHTNKKRLDNILYQLVSNSIKFRSNNRKPEIQIHLNGNDAYHSLKIRDNGSGIDLEKFGPKLFYPFQKFHYGIAGKGLGLYRVKLQTESLGGKVNISSKVDEFTEVEVLLKK